MAFARELAQEDDACFDLWTWLPSYHNCTRLHGDMWHHHHPPNHAIIKEAVVYISYLIDGRGTEIARNVEENMDSLTQEEQIWFSCPCEEHSV